MMEFWVSGPSCSICNFVEDSSRYSSDSSESKQARASFPRSLDHLVRAGSTCWQIIPLPKSCVCPLVQRWTSSPARLTYSVSTIVAPPLDFSHRLANQDSFARKPGLRRHGSFCSDKVSAFKAELPAH